MSCLVGANLYLHAYPETTWGTKPASPAYFALPIENYSVEVQRNIRASRPFFGNMGQKHSQLSTISVAGAMSGALYAFKLGALTKSLAQTMIELGYGTGTETSECALPSIGTEWAQGPNIANVNHHGIRFNTFTLSGEAEGRWEWSADVMGRHETALATAQVMPANLYRAVEINFAGTVFEIAPIVDGVIGTYTQIQVENASIVRSNNIKVRYGGNVFPHMTAKTTRQTTLSLTLVKTNDSWKAIARDFSLSGVDEMAVRVTMRGRTSGSLDDDWQTIQFQFNRAHLTNASDAYNIEDFTETTLNFNALVPDSVLKDVAITFAGANDPEED